MSLTKWHAASVCLVSLALGIVDVAPAIATDEAIYITESTPALSDMIEKGPVRVVVNYTPLEAASEGSENLKYRLFFNNNPIASLNYTAGYRNGSASVVIEDFDSDEVPEVIFTEYTGGNHCCLNKTMFGLQGETFGEIDTRLLNSVLGGGQIEDLNGDGYSEFIQVDTSFYLQFGSFAATFLPPNIVTYQEGAFTDTTREFPDYIRTSIVESEQRLTDSGRRSPSNAFFPGYVASKALLGEFEEAWAFMLNNYNPQLDWDSTLEITNESGDVVGYHPDYPTALRAFLAERNYL